MDRGKVTRSFWRLIVLCQDQGWVLVSRITVWVTTALVLRPPPLSSVPEGVLVPHPLASPSIPNLSSAVGTSVFSVPSTGKALEELLANDIEAGVVWPLQALAAGTHLPGGSLVEAVPNTAA